MIQFLDLVQTVQMAMKALQMYTPAHPRSQSSLEALTRDLHTWLKEKPSLHIAVSNNKVFMDGVAAEGKSLHLSALQRQFSERQISGFVIQQGVTAEELMIVLNLLIMKPARIEEQGGPAQILARESLPHVQLSQVQYREIKEGSGGPEDDTLAPARKALPAEPEKEARPEESRPEDPLDETLLAQTLTPAANAALAEVAVAMKKWREALAGSVGEAPQPDPFTGLLPDAAPGTPFFAPGFKGELPPARLAHLGDLARAQGWGEAFPGPPQLEALRGALLDLPAPSQYSIVAGMPTLPSLPPSLRMGFTALAPEVLGTATASLLADDIPWSDLREVLYDILRFSSQKSAMLEALSLQLEARGLDPGGLGALLHQLDWEGRNMEEKLRLAVEEKQLWGLSPEQRLSFVRQLLDEGRIDNLLEVLDQILEALTVEDPMIREAAAKTLAGMAHWIKDPGLPVEAEAPMVQGLTAHFGWEPVPHIHRATTESMEQVLAAMVERGDLGETRALLEELASLSEFLEEKQPWRDEALARLQLRITRPDLLKAAVDHMHATDPEQVLSTMIPFLEFVGEPAARHLVDVLGEEPDRKRRGRLLDVIRVLGELAIPALRDGLESSQWYLVRNTLNLLADMSDASLLQPVLGCLEHPDMRVRRSAVRAAWRLAGPGSEPHLLELLPRTDPETQVEILFALAQMKSLAATPVLTTLAADAHLNEKLRVRVTDTLAQIADPKALPALLELLKRKGRIFTSAEPLDLRLAAAKGVLAIGQPEGVAALKKLAEDEPRGEARDAFRQLVARP